MGKILASQLVEKLQQVINENGDFPVNLDFDPQYSDGYMYEENLLDISVKEILDVYTYKNIKIINIPC